MFQGPDGGEEEALESPEDPAVRGLENIERPVLSKVEGEGQHPKLSSDSHKHSIIDA